MKDMCKAEILLCIGIEEDAVANIERQLAKYREDLNTDWEWVGNATYAKKKKKAKLQLLYRELGLRNKAIKLEKSQRIERLFVNIARESLSTELFGHIMRQALEGAENA